MTISHSKQFKSFKREGKAQKAISEFRRQATEFIREFFKANKTICIGVVGALAIMAFIIGLANIKELADGKSYLKNMKNEITATTLDETKDLQAIYESEQSEIIKSEIEKHLMVLMADGKTEELTPEKLEELTESVYDSVLGSLSASKKSELTEDEKESVKLLITEAITRIDFSDMTSALESLSKEFESARSEELNKLKQQEAALAENKAQIEANKEDIENQSKTKSGIFSGIWEAMAAANTKIEENKLISDTTDEELWNSINDVNGKFNSVFQSVSDGKFRVGTTLTELGVPTVS
ncbi:MAG: hypothetical protein HUJ70_09615, partial [Pseudobutyrivibrio sp.]|nr:hypothetical protein [Pseudobutyrivibrio sp.]